MTYEVIIPGHLHMPLYFIGTFTEYPYVKYNFLRDREFTSIEQLNEEVQAWLKRTANGMEHHGIHRIPSVEFEMERPHLMTYRGVPTIPSPKLLTRVM